VDGKLISEQGTEAIGKGLKIIFLNLEYKSNLGYVGKDYSMAAKEKLTIVMIQFVKQPLPSLEFMNAAINRTSLDIYYKSFYKESFHFHDTKFKCFILLDKIEKDFKFLSIKNY